MSENCLTFSFKILLISVSVHCGHITKLERQDIDRMLLRINRITIFCFVQDYLLIWVLMQMNGLLFRKKNILINISNFNSGDDTLGFRIFYLIIISKWDDSSGYVVLPSGWFEISGTFSHLVIVEKQKSFLPDLISTGFRLMT